MADSNQGYIRRWFTQFPFNDGAVMRVKLSTLKRIPDSQRFEIYKDAEMQMPLAVFRLSKNVSFDEEFDQLMESIQYQKRASYTSPLGLRIRNYFSKDALDKVQAYFEPFRLVSSEKSDFFLKAVFELTTLGLSPPKNLLASHEPLVDFWRSVKDANIQAVPSYADGAVALTFRQKRKSFARLELFERHENDFLKAMNEALEPLRRSVEVDDAVLERIQLVFEEYFDDWDSKTDYKASYRYIVTTLTPAEGSVSVGFPIDQMEPVYNQHGRQICPDCQRVVD